MSPGVPGGGMGAEQFERRISPQNVDLMVKSEKQVMMSYKKQYLEDKACFEKICLLHGCLIILRNLN